jgi:hypothetical protein
MKITCLAPIQAGPRDHSPRLFTSTGMSALAEVLGPPGTDPSFYYVKLIIPFSRMGCAETVAPSVGALPHAEFCTPFRNTRQREQRLLT